MAWEILSHESLNGRSRTLPLALQTMSARGSTIAERVCLDNDHTIALAGDLIKGADMSGGGGGKDSYYWYTKGLGAVMINNPDYGKMAADSIAQEVAERKLDVPTPDAPAVDTGSKAD